MFPARPEAGRRVATSAGARVSGGLGKRARPAGIAVIAFAAAFAIDMATGQWFSQVVGSVAIAVSLLGVWGKREHWRILSGRMLAESYMLSMAFALDAGAGALAAGIAWCCPASDRCKARNPCCA